MMLAFFPAPYPDEWWYSVLCRYYVRSGYTRTSMVLNELHEKQHMNHGTLFPNRDCYVTVKNLPSDVFSLKAILLEHTLMPYYLRFYPSERKEKILNDILSGMNAPVSKVYTKTPDGRRGLKFCPLCYEEDVKNYGEPYWHREHQIPLMPVCPKHRIRLNFVELSLNRLRESFVPLCKIENTADSAQPAGLSVWEQPLADALFSILTLPFADGPAQGYSNLKNMLLLNNGFSRQKIRMNGSFDTETLRRQCFEFYGKNIAEQYFAGFSYDSIYNICKWRAAAPEQYALLSVFIGLSVEELFGAEIRPSPDPVLKQMLEYKKRKVSCKKVDLARLMGISSFQLDSLTKKYGVEPFWTQRNNSRTETIAIQLTSEEKQKVFAAVSLCGGGSAAAFARTILLREADRILNG